MENTRRRALIGGGGGGKIYGVAINLSNTDPETAVTYTDAAVGMTPGSSAWDSTEIFSGIRPCLLLNGVVNKYLNPNNFAQDVNGNSVDITSGAAGDVMIEFPKMGYKIETNGNIMTVQVTTNPNMGSEGFRYYAFTRQNEGDCKHLYVGAYDASSVTIQIGIATNKKLVSLSGKSPLTNIALDLFRQYSTLAGEGYSLFSFYPLVLLQCLYLIRYKNLNSQAALGNGISSSPIASNSGITNANGMYYGRTDSTSTPVKFAGIENLWGNVGQLLGGIRIDASRNILTAFDNFNFNGDGYSNQGQYSTNRVMGTIGHTQGTTEKGFLPKNISLSSTTYFCDRGDLDKSEDIVVGGGRSNSVDAGIFYCDGVTSTTSTTGCRLMYLKAGQ